MIGTIRRIRWRNLAGLAVFIVVVFAVVALASLLNTVIYGDCVEKNSVKVCFSMEDSEIGRYESTSVSIEVSNTGENTRGAEVSMRLSPNLENKSSTVQRIGEMAPGDTVERSFRIAAKGERGDFKLAFDINGDGLADKELFMAVE